MRISDAGINLIYILRQLIGKDNVAIGPDIGNLIKAWELPLASLREAIEEIESIGFIRIDRGINCEPKATPTEMRGITGITVKESLQRYCDEFFT